MLRRGVVLLGVVLVAVSVSACAGSATPESLPTSTSSTTPSSTATPSASTTPTTSPSSSPSATTEPSEPPPPSNPPPLQVQGLRTSEGGGSGEVLIRWTQNPEADVISYVVLRATTPGGTLTSIGTATRDDVTQFEFAPFVDSRATVAYYRVRAVDTAGQAGPLSVEVCGASVGYSC